MGEILMMRVAEVLFVMSVMITALSTARAGESVCPDGSCFPGDFRPGHPIGRAHDFRPRLRDGVPLTNDFQDYPEGYHGVGCVWSRRRVATRKGLVWAVVPFCLDY